MCDFQKEVSLRIASNSVDSQLLGTSAAFMHASILPKYSYNFYWEGRPIIQYPQDMVAMQELIWAIQPDLIIETGIAHGGSLIFSASMLALLDYCEAQKNKTLLDPANPARNVLGIDIDIRAHNRAAIEAHPMFSRIEMIEGSSIEPKVIDQVVKYSRNYKRILVCLDSHHTHNHVLAELEAYAPLVSPGSYCVVFDTIVEDLPKEFFPDRPWGPGNNPKTAVWEYLASLKNEGRNAVDGTTLDFEIDKEIENKLLITVAPDGFLKRVQ